MLVSLQQGLGLALHGVGQALLASNFPLEDLQWMQNKSFLATEPLKVAQALLALQIALVTFRRPLVPSITILKTLYFVALVSFWITHNLHIDSNALYGIVLMSIGSLLFGLGSPNEQRHLAMATKKKSFKQETAGHSQINLKTTSPYETMTETNNAFKMTTHLPESPFTTLSPTRTKSGKKLSSPAPPPPPEPRLIALPFPPTAEVCAQIVLEKYRSETLPRHSSSSRESRDQQRLGSLRGDVKVPALPVKGLSPHTPGYHTNAPTTHHTSPAITLAFSSQHGAASLPAVDHRVATAFQKDPYKLNLNELLGASNDTNQVFSPGYFQSGRPINKSMYKEKDLSSSSSLEILEEVEGEPYQLYHYDDE